MARPVSYELVFDGGSLGNPGRGYGSFRMRRAGGKWSEPERLEFGDHVTNNEAEYRALIAALEAVAASVDDPRAVSLRVLTDSRLVAEQLRGKWKVRATNLAPLHAAARRKAAQFGAVRYKWHPRKESVRLLGH